MRVSCALSQPASARTETGVGRHMNAQAPPRKIIHVDMDAFYASVEQRDDPTLRGRPVVVAWRGPRSVVCAASYEARRYGVRSAMPAVTAERLCPQAVFVPPDFVRYRAVSRQVRAILDCYSDCVEPLSLDEAYLDVSSNKAGLATATRVARAIRADIARETSLTASAGVAPNKFLAKIASDWRKPDGLCVIQPHEARDFVASLPVGRLPGVGRTTEQRLQLLGISTVADLRTRPASELTRLFGRFGLRLQQLALGEDDAPVEPCRPLQQVSVEQTLETDLVVTALSPVVRECAARAWVAAGRTGQQARTVVLKLKTADFQLLTRSQTPATPPASADAVQDIALALLSRVELPMSTRYRLAGVGLSNFMMAPEQDPQSRLF